MKLRDRFGLTIIGVIVIALIVSLFVADYRAYRQRSPQASPWTYLFKG